MNALRKLTALGWRDHLLLLEAWLYLGAARLALLTVAFRHIARHLGHQFPPEHKINDQPPSQIVARQVAWAVDLMSRHTPWESACLAQSIAGMLMLRRRGLATRLFLGTRKDEAGQLVAHAWLQSGQEILLGGAGRETFTELASFAESPPPQGPP